MIFLVPGNQPVESSHRFSNLHKVTMLVRMVEVELGTEVSKSHFFLLPYAVKPPLLKFMILKDSKDAGVECDDIGWMMMAAVLCFVCLSMGQLPDIIFA